MHTPDKVRVRKGWGLRSTPHVTCFLCRGLGSCHRIAALIQHVLHFVQWYEIRGAGEGDLEEGMMMVVVVVWWWW